MPNKPFFIKMKKKRKHLRRLRDTTRLFLSSGVAMAAGSLVLAIFSWITGISPPLPQVLLGFAVVAGLNAWLLKWHENLNLAYLVAAVSSLVAILWVSLYSGGLSSPFVFFLGLLILAGYIKRPLFGHLSLVASLLAVAFLLAQGQMGIFPAHNAVPEDVQPLFSFACLALFLILLGGVFGRSLLSDLRSLYHREESLERQLEEKEMLLKEVHHRVKNNLQTVSSLLRMQGRSIEDAQTLSQIRSSQNRVVCMAMVHEMLYRREDLSCIEYSSYVQQLGDYLVKSLKGTESNIKLNIDIPEMELGIDTAIPLGLLINEAVTNALKYGFEGRDEGEISISLEKEDQHEYVLRIGDNGVGYPETMDYQASKSLGLKLIHNLSRQLKGSVIRDLSKRGTNYIIRFQEVTQDPFHSMA